MGYEEEMFLISFLDDQWRSPPALFGAVGRKRRPKGGLRVFSEMLRRLSAQGAIEKKSTATGVVAKRYFRGTKRVFKIEEYRKRQYACEQLI